MSVWPVESAYILFVFWCINLRVTVLSCTLCFIIVDTCGSLTNTCTCIHHSGHITVHEAIIQLRHCFVLLLFYLIKVYMYCTSG